MFKYKFKIIREYILIFLTATIFFLQSSFCLHAKENIFVVRDIKIEGFIDINFSRNKFINEAFRQSFDKLISNILLLEDRAKLRNLKLNEIKNLIYSFKILEESFKNNKYFAIFEISYNDNKIKKLLNKKNISFFHPKNTVVIFFPILFVNDEIKLFNENFFYNNWLNNSSSGDIIKYILPLEDIEDIHSIRATKDEIENMNFMEIANKYNIKNYAAVIINYKSNLLKIYIKTSLDSKKYSENLSYELNNWNDNSQLNLIMKDLKEKILDMWKKANLINIPLPLNISVKFNYKNLSDIDNLEEALKKIHVINSYSLEKFNIKNSFFKISYYGDPNKLKDQFLEFNYILKDIEGYWELQKK